MLAAWLFGHRRWLLMMHAPPWDVETSCSFGLAAVALRIRCGFDVMLTHLPGGDPLAVVSALKERVSGREFLRAIREVTSLCVPDQFEGDQDLASVSSGDPSRVWLTVVAWATGGRGGALTPTQEERARRLVEPGGGP
jgi:hypothetical protein